MLINSETAKAAGKKSNKILQKYLEQGMLQVEVL
mgnify:CR=1 FL=1